MQIINTIDEQSFTLNGVKYVKNFIAIKSGEDSLIIANLYDTRFILLSSTRYSDIQLNGTVYSSLNALMTALATVLFFKKNVQDIPYLGSIIPTSPTYTGATGFWTATQAGTYTNFGSVVVSGNSFATISKASGGFSISQTPIEVGGYVSLTSPSFSGTPTAPTASAGTSTNQIANTKFVNDYFEPYKAGTWTQLSPATGYICAVLDSESRLLYGVKLDGSFVVSKYAINTIGGSALINESISIDKLDSSVTNGLWKSVDPATGYMCVILDSEDRILFGIKTNGKIVGDFQTSIADNSITLSKLDTSINTKLNSIVPTTQIRCWGDSLTAGAGGTAYPSTLQTLLPDFSVINCGVGGEATTTIAARQGGVPVRIISGFTLPSDGSTVAIATTTGGTANKYGSIIVPLLQGSGNSVNPCYVSGIECTLSYNSSTYYLKRNVPSSAHTTISSGELLQLNGSKSKNVLANIYWIGQNGGYGNVEDRLVDYYRDMVAYNGNSNYIVIGLHSGGTTRESLENKLFNEFGANFFNWRKYAVAYGLEDAGITPTSQDVIDMANGEIPTSLLSDAVHLNTAGYTVLANALFQRGKQLGIWL